MDKYGPLCLECGLKNKKNNNNKYCPLCKNIVYRRQTKEQAEKRLADSIRCKELRGIKTKFIDPKWLVRGPLTYSTGESGIVNGNP